MNHVTIRDMAASDIYAVHAIETSSFNSPWSEHSIAAEIASSQSIKLVALRNDSIVGYVMARQVLDEGQLLDLAMHTRYRRKGISGILMNELLRKLRDNSCLVVYLEVRASNEPAINLYKKYGFETISARKDYYKKPVEDALIMKLEIK